MAKPTQTEIVLKHLLRKGSITSWEAIEKYKITRLSALIYTLKDLGHDIVSERVYKKGKWWVKYSLWPIINKK